MQSSDLLRRLIEDMDGAARFSGDRSATDLRRDTMRAAAIEQEV